MKLSKKDKERAHVIGWLKAASLPLELADEGESPDFWLKDATGRLIGLEHVTLTDEQLKRSLVLEPSEARLTEALRSRGLKQFVAIGLYPNQQVLSSKAKAQAFETSVIEFLAKTRSPLPPEGLHLLSKFDEAGQPTLPPLVNRISIWSETADPKVVLSSAGLSDTGLMARAVSTRLSEKGELLKKYRLAHPGREFWLLIVTGEDLSQHVHYAPVPVTFTTEFERVYIYDVVAASQQQLTTTHP